MIDSASRVGGLAGWHNVSKAWSLLTGMELVSAALLVYCMGTVPVQLSLWNDMDPCDRVPTWAFDMSVDIFFLVRLQTGFSYGKRGAARLGAGLGVCVDPLHPSHPPGRVLGSDHSVE